MSESIQVSDAKTVLRLIVDESKVVFITIWPNVELGRIQVEIAHGTKVRLIKKGDFVHMQYAMKDVGVKIDVLTAGHLAGLIRKNIEANQ